jgi:hypothetical protein
MINKNIIYGGAGVIGVGVLYFLYSKLPNNNSEEKNNNSRSSSVDSDDESRKDYESWTGIKPKTINWGGGKSKKNKKIKHIRNRKGKNSRRK